MTEREFRRLTTIYGADLRRWPSGRREAAERMRVAHPEFAADLRQAAEVDRLLQAAAPQIGAARIESALAGVMRGTEAVRQIDGPSFDGALPVLLSRAPDGKWRWAPQGMLYLGLFILGCATNLAVRLLVAQTPLDLWFAGNLSLPLGG